MRRTFGLAVTLASFCACIDDPTFVLSDGGDAGVTPGGDAGPTPTGSTTATAPPTTTATTPPPPSKCDASCTAAGGTCESSTCAFRCPGPGPLGAACGNEIKCPAGTDCLVACNAKNACKRITCNTTESCAITCSGDTACSDQITASAPKTTINCNGNSACKKVDCEGASCAVTCTGNACGPPDVKCCAKPCTVNGAAGMCKN